MSLSKHEPSLRAAVLAIVLAAAACAGPTFIVQQYAGRQRAPDSIATLRVDGREPVRLLYLDEQDVAAPIMEDGRLHIEILPGVHSVVVASTKAPDQRYAPVSFEAGEGRFYRVVVGSGAAAEARVFEVGAKRDDLVRDVTRAEPAVPARPASSSVPERAGRDASAPDGSAEADAG